MSDNTWNVISDSLELLRNAAALITDANREAPTPCSEWNATQVLQHALGDQLAWAAAIGVGTGPSANPFTPSGRLEGSVDDLVESALLTARTAWAGVRSDDGAVPTPLPHGALPAPTAAGACALDAAVHAWDIAVATGQPSALTPAVARQLMSVATRIVEPLRAYGAYGPAIATEDDDVAALLGYLGRDVTWRP
jgi:uncharacterized protein (TIGR03086 family)